MKNKVVALLLCLAMAASLVACGGSAGSEETAQEEGGSEAAEEAEETEEEPAAEAAEGNDDFAGEELSIIVSADWMNDYYDSTIARFEDTYNVTVDLQTIPADQYFDILQSKLETGTCTDVFWIQSSPVGLVSAIGNPEEYCLDFTGEAWESVMPEARLAACKYDGKLYGLQIWHNSPEYVMVYNKTMFEEMDLTAPKTYAELKSVCEKLAAEGITPWFMPGADGWQHQLAFFQIGGVYEEAQPGLYEALNNNTATFAGNEKMLEVLGQFKELSDAGYFGEDWIGMDSSNMANEFGDRNCAMAMANSSYINQIKEETGTEDEFGLFLIPLGDNEWFPTSPAGPTMFGYAGTEHPELVKEWFRFVTTTQSLQEILDTSDKYTNLDVTDENVVQHWLPEEEEFMNTVDKSKMNVSVLQNGTKYTNDYWMDFGADLIAYCQGTMDANTVLSNMDANRAAGAATVGDEAWK